MAELLTVTYVLEDEGQTVGFYSLMNDKISHDDFGSRNQFKKIIKGLFSSKKQFKSYPAMKIARLAINNSHQGQEIGTATLDFLKLWFRENNKTGCRFITVDAYSQSLRFYEKNGFKYMTKHDLNSDTRAMFYNLHQDI